MTKYPPERPADVPEHFRGLRKDPPPHLAGRWYALVLRRMAGQNVDVEIAALLDEERAWNEVHP